MNSFLALAPLLVIAGGALLVLLLDAFIEKEAKDFPAYVSILILAASALVSIRSWNQGLTYFDGMLRLDNLALFFILLLTIGVAFVCLIGMKYLSLQGVPSGEFYGLLLLALSGLMIMTSSSHFLVIFLGLEVLSVSSYALAGLKRTEEKSGESAVKYFLMGSFASAFLVLGLALLFGSCGSLEIPVITARLASTSEGRVLALVGFGLVVIGFAFKIALVPFHMWTPDVYEGAPTPVAAFFSVGPKTAGFAVLLKPLLPYWNGAVKSQAFFWLVAGVAVLTMVVGNLTAIRQKNIKRLLAYSSISHAGYILLAVLAADASSLLFYLSVYLFMSLGAFGALMALAKKDTEYVEIDDFAGVGFKYPWIGAIFAVFLFSLAGFPPTGGFLAKFYVFAGAVRQGLTPLVIIGVLASLVSVYYYLRIVVYMYMRPPSREIEIETENPALFLVLFLCLYGVLQLGIFPANILQIIRQTVASLL